MNSEFNQFKNQMREKYNSFLKCHSPALNSDVNFNAKGFNHITFRNPRNQRTIGDQKNRLNIIEKAFEFVGFTNTFQEYEIIEGDKNIQYWGLVAIFKDVKMKVILRKIGNGEIHFWSVIPFYKTSEKRDGKLKMKGNPEID